MRRQLIARRQKDISRLIRQRRKTHRAKLKAYRVLLK